MDGRLQAPYPSFKLPRRGHFFAARSAKKRRQLSSGQRCCASLRRKLPVPTLRPPALGISILWYLGLRLDQVSRTGFGVNRRLRRTRVRASSAGDFALETQRGPGPRRWFALDRV